MSDPFLTTRWSVVLAAGRGDVPEAAEALAELCGAYWYPLYAFVRRRGWSGQDAEDLVQGFFCDLLARRDLAGLDPERGRFRAFLLAAIRNYTSKQRAHDGALKRGGGRVSLSIDFDEAAERYRNEPVTDETPERLFERSWALELLAKTLDGLRAEYEETGRGRVFEALQGELEGEAPAGTRAQLAGELGMTEGALKVAAHRLRARYRERLREEIAGTVERPADVDAELRALLEAL